MKNLLGKLLGLKVWFILLITLVIFVDIKVWGVVTSPAFGDFVVANVARAHYDGAPVEFDAGYSYDRVTNIWKIETNSKWLLDKVTDVVPFMEYEGVVRKGFSNYPVSAMVVPMKGDRSFHILGQAVPPVGIFEINERLTVPGLRYDERQALSTVVHELIHLQPAMVGVFNGGAVIEPTTQAATIELLAAMCNYRDEVACGAFWKELHRASSTSAELYAKKEGWYWFFNLWENTFWLNAEDRMAYGKSDRHWSADKELSDERDQLLEKYAAGPWRKYIVPGVRLNIPILTGETLWFDDVRSMLGFWAWFAIPR